LARGRQAWGAEFAEQNNSGATRRDRTGDLLITKNLSFSATYSSVFSIT
jgi:hypothetical protein